VTTTRRESISPATVAEWRRRRETSAEQSPASDSEEPLTGFRLPAYTAKLHASDTVPTDFAKSQQAGLTAIIELASAAASPPSTPAVRPPAPRVPRPTPPPDRAITAPPVQPVTAAPLSAQVTVRPQTSGHPAPPSPSRPAAKETGSAKPTAGRAVNSAPPLPALPLIVILTVQAVLSLRLVWSNTAFSDEALYLWAGRLDWSHWLHNTPIPSFATYFSGAPVLYPPIGAVANSVGGLVGARILSLCFMLGATILLYGVTRRIFDRHTAVFASALFAGVGSTQYLGAFATYDAVALCLLAAATWLGIRAAACHSITSRAALVILAAGAVVVADATKYAAGLFDPIILIAVTCIHWRKLGRRAGVAAAFLFLSTAIIGISAALALGGEPYYAGIIHTTLSRAHGNWPIFGILFVSTGWIGAVAVLAVIGAAAASCHRRTAPERVLVWTLAAAAFLAPAEQARIQVYTSLFKHVVFGGWFAAVVAGYAMTSFIQAVPIMKSRGALRAVTAAIALAAIAGSTLAANQFSTWQNANPVLPTLTATLRAHPGALLTDEAAQFDYYIQAVEPWQLITPISNSSSRALSRNIEDIKQHRFAFILLSFAVGGGGCGNEDPTVKGTHAKCMHYIDLHIMSEIISSGGYNLIARIPYRTASFHSAYMLWARKGPQR
jgi:4-amino-4-deoxy-L-arabinose transferase-like glycosyltransferase